MEGKWFRSIREFLYKMSCAVRIKGVWTPRLQRKNDQCIMEVLRECQDTKRINRVRIYLQATTIADITNAEGSKICDYAFGGRHSRTSESPRKSTHEWPRQPRPGPKSWKAWREAIQLTLSTDGKSQKLRHPLGDWIIHQANTRQEWNWYVDTDTGELLAREGIKLHVHKAKDKATQFNNVEHWTIDHLPTTAIPVSAIDFQVQKIPKEIKYQTAEHQDNNSKTFEDYVDTLEDWERNLLRTTGNVRDTEDVTDRINTSEKSYMVSDGGMIN
jgi:hypothetical protein